MWPSTTQPGPTGRVGLGGERWAQPKRPGGSASGISGQTCALRPFPARGPDWPHPGFPVLRAARSGAGAGHQPAVRGSSHPEIASSRPSRRWSTWRPPWISRPPTPTKPERRQRWSGQEEKRGSPSRSRALGRLRRVGVPTRQSSASPRAIDARPYYHLCLVRLAEVTSIHPTGRGYLRAYPLQRTPAEARLSRVSPPRSGGQQSVQGNRPKSRRGFLQKGAWPHLQPVGEHAVEGAQHP